MSSSAWRWVWMSCVLLTVAAPAAADYVADDTEIAAMKARILANPPTADTLTAAPYPGSKLDAECSADQSASNQPNMVYCLYTLDPIEKVKEYLAGPGKPTDGVSVFVDRDSVSENGYVKIADVTQMRYYVFAKKKAAAQAATAPAPTEAPAAPAPAAAEGPAVATAAEAPAAPAAPAQEKQQSSDTAEKAVEGVKKLKGLFGL